VLANAKAEYEPIPPLPFTLRSSQSTCCTAAEMENAIWEESGDEDSCTIDTGDDTDQIFDSDDEDEFDPQTDRDDICADENMDQE
jgi:hypothetical protein